MISCAVIALLTCVFIFIYTKSQASHDMTHLYIFSRAGHRELVEDRSSVSTKGLFCCLVKENLLLPLPKFGKAFLMARLSYHVLLK